MAQLTIANAPVASVEQIASPVSQPAPSAVQTGPALVYQRGTAPEVARGDVQLPSVKPPPDSYLPRRDPVALKADIVTELDRYHDVSGQGNGSPTHDLQLPPGVPDRDALNTFIDDAATCVAHDDAVWYAATPTDPAKRKAARAALAAARLDEVSKNGKPKLLAMVGHIVDPKIRQLTQQALDAAPPEFWTVASSSTGMHHPADEINPGGLAYHVARVATMAEFLCDHYQVTGRQKDEIVAAALLHDIKKGGDPWNKYAANHGPLASKWLAGLWKNSNGPSTTKIRELVNNHMAQWNEPVSTPPQDLANQIMSYADYIAALDTVFVQV